MPGNKVQTLKKLQSRKGAVTGGHVHPNSRRAKQLQRIELRTKKLEVKSKVRRSTEIGKGMLYVFLSSAHRSSELPVAVDRHVYFVHALPEDREAVTLPELHQILRDYIGRNDDEAAELKKEREGRAWRKGEGKSKREMELDVQREGEESEYRSGFVLPDLTLAANVFLCRQWVAPLPSAKNVRGQKGGDPSFLGRLRLIRISSADETSVVVQWEGAREGEWDEAGGDDGEVEMADGSGPEDEGDAEIAEGWFRSPFVGIDSDTLPSPGKKSPEVRKL
ncbi:translation machinery-associated protein 16, partial [Phenoliferia sp. Uapishka_3]